MTDWIKILFVLHQDTILPPNEAPVELKANPILSEKGMLDMHALIEQIRQHGPFQALYCSRMARTADCASQLALAFDLEFQSCKGLGQHAKLDAQGQIHYYPGFERESYPQWETQLRSAINDMYMHHDSTQDAILAVSHRPIVACVVAAAQGVEDSKEMDNIARNYLKGKNFILAEVEVSQFCIGPDPDDEHPSPVVKILTEG